MRLERLLCLALIGIASLLGSPADATDRALLVTIGRYGPASPLPSLPGAEIDRAKMDQVARVMGFAPDQIRHLTDEAATAAGIRSAITTWLIQGTAPGDRALLYFSGHGSQVVDRGIQDEEDGWDEVLAGHDVRLVTRDGRPYAIGVVTDDELFGLLGRLADREVTVVVDACSSATATRGPAAGATGSVAWMTKSGLLERTVPTDPGTRPAPDAALADPGHEWITLAAAPDGREAIATPYGSLFTQALHARLLEARPSNSALPMVAVQAAMTDYLSNRDALSPLAPPPVLTGPTRLTGKGIRLVPPGPHAPIRRDIERLAAPASGSILSATRTRYQLAERIALTVEVPRSGYLNVIVVDSDDTARVLFPNAYHPDNLFSGATRVALSQPALPFNLEASEPVGESYVLAIFTDTARPLNFYQEALAEYGETQGVRRGLARLSTSAMLAAKGIQVRAPQPEYLAQGLTIHVSAPP